MAADTLEVTHFFSVITHFFMPCTGVNCLQYAPVPKRTTRAHGHIYFLQSPKTHYIKIGYSKDVKRRLQDLRAHHPDAKLLASFYCRGPARFERIVHGLFSDLRIHGLSNGRHSEWFRPNGRIFDFIAFHEPLTDPEEHSAHTNDPSVSTQESSICVNSLTATSSDAKHHNRASLRRKMEYEWKLRELRRHRKP